MIEVLEWSGLVIGGIAFMLGIIFQDSEEYLNNERRWSFLAGCGTVIYLLCATLILKPILWEHFQMRIKTVGLAVVLSLLILSFIAQGIRKLKNKNTLTE